MQQLRSININEELYFYSFSFDITDEYIGDGLWWLQIYDSEKQMIYDKPFASASYRFEESDIISGVKKGLELLRL